MNLSPYERMHGNRLVGILLLITLFSMPTWYYPLIQGVGMIWFVIQAFLYFRNKLKVLVLFSILLAILVQPIYALFAKEITSLLNLGIGAVVVLFSFWEGYSSDE
jgi:hypothetical protein